jgi:hypothetical protein
VDHEEPEELDDVMLKVISVGSVLMPRWSRRARKFAT